MQLTRKGFTAKRDLIFAGELITQLVHATGSQLDIETANYLRVQNDEQMIELADNEMNVQAKRFVVKAADNQIVFDVDSDQLATVASGPLVRQALGGHKLADHLDTSTIQGSLNQDLR